MVLTKCQMSVYIVLYILVLASNALFLPVQNVTILPVVIMITNDSALRIKLV